MLLRTLKQALRHKAFWSWILSTRESTAVSFCILGLKHSRWFMGMSDKTALARRSLRILYTNVHCSVVCSARRDQH